jgi:hypothetical protein
MKMMIIMIKKLVKHFYEILLLKYFPHVRIYTYNIIRPSRVLVNPRYLNGGDDDDEDEILSNPRRPSPTSQAYSSSNASSIRSGDIEIEINKKSEKNLCIRSNKKNITDLIQPEKVDFSLPSLVFIKIYSGSFQTFQYSSTRISNQII